MAVSIPAGIYSLGNVRIDDSQRLANLEGQLLAKKAAKQQAEQDAINKYIADQAGKVTSTGVRTVDLPGFEKRRQQWMQFGMQNKEKILKDPMTRVSFDKMGQELMSYIQQSKAEEEKAKPIKSLIVDPTKRKELNTDRVMLDIDYHDLPLDDPRRRSIDYNASWYKAPTFDFVKEFDSAAKGQQKSYLGEVKGSFNPKSGKYLTEQGFAPKAITQIASNFVRAVQESPDKQDYYERKAQNMDAREIADLNTYFSRYFPDQQVEADNPLTIAAAEAIRQAESARDIVPETDVRYASSLISSRQRGGETETPVRDVYGEIISKAANKAPNKGVPLNELSGTAQSQILKTVNATTGGGYTQSDIFVMKDRNGDLVAIDDATKQVITPLTYEDINVPLQPGAKEKRAVIVKGSSKKKLY
jgi:hypothetical protein